MADYYAWAPITIPDSVIKGKITTIPVGDKVAKGKLTDADFSDLIAAGVLRREKYPEGVRTDESPRQAKLRAINAEMKRLTAPFETENDNDNDDLEDEDSAT